MVMTLAAPRVSTTAAREMGRRHRFNALVAMPWARALVGSADPSPHAVSAHAGDGRYRFRPPGGEIASTALLNRHFTVAPKAAVFRVLKYDTLDLPAHSGRSAPGKAPFVAAVELNREGRPMRMRLSRVGAFRSGETAALARCHIEPGNLPRADNRDFRPLADWKPALPGGWQSQSEPCTCGDPGR